MSNLVVTPKTIIVGEVDWLRNDYISDIKVGNITYRSVEHAYQAAKFKDINTKKLIADAPTVRDARQIGRKGTIREDWESVKYTVMESLIRQKFTTNDILSDRLSKTGTAEIVMEGYDEFWGTGRSGQGENSLGVILMAIRSEIQFISGHEDEPEKEEEESAPTLKEAILSNPDEALADACQELYVGVKALMTLVDPADFDARFIQSRTGVSLGQAEDAIKKLQSMQSALTSMEDLLASEADEDDDLPSVEDSDSDVEEPQDEWLKAFD